jgi:hypothetical protein
MTDAIVPVNKKEHALTKREKTPVFAQIDDLEKNYTIAPDGTVVKINDYFANPESPEKQLS